jgi:hypothetical protein
VAPSVHVRGTVLIMLPGLGDWPNVEVHCQPAGLVISAWWALPMGSIVMDPPIG